MNVHFNAEQLYKDLEVIGRHKGVSWREMADEIGVSPSTLTRLRTGSKPDADSLAAIFRWTGVKFETYIQTHDVHRLESAPELPKEPPVRVAAPSDPPDAAAPADRAPEDGSAT